jgi:hypothetical protein
MPVQVVPAAKAAAGNASDVIDVDQACHVDTDRHSPSTPAPVIASRTTPT